MADSEKLTALKKAYADIILNTAKEAAARIMVSEKKALRFQQELFTAKEEALHMLLRLKQMLDSKVNEAEMASLSQQRRIEELEAQLGEAEDIVKDLRSELREVLDELEKMTNNQTQPLDKQNTYGDVVTQATTTQENGLDTFGSVISSLPNLQPELFTSSDVRNLTLNEAYEGDKCYNENGSHKDNCYVFSSDFASIVMRRKEPELYRNGCTQRIRAFERNLLDGKLSLSGQVDDVKNETLIREDEEGKDMGIKLTPKAGKLYGVEKDSDEFKVMQADNKFIQVHSVKSFRRKKRKGATRYKKALSCRNFPDQVVQTCQASELSCPEILPCAVDRNAQSGENSRVAENQAQKDPESPLSPKLLTNTTQSGCVEDTKSDAEFVKACSVQKMKIDNELLIDKLELMTQESASAESLEFPACKTDLETVNVSSVSSDVKAPDLTEGVLTQPINNRFLKYTFKRKRKKESLSSPDGNCSLDDSTTKRKTGEKPNGSLESQKSSLITESSRDSRRLAQVARQLISLSEKKWWQ